MLNPDGPDHIQAMRKKILEWTSDGNTIELLRWKAETTFAKKSVLLKQPSTEQCYNRSVRRDVNKKAT